MNKKASIAIVLTVVGIFAATFSLAAISTTPTYAQNVGAATTNATRLNATAGPTANATTGSTTLGKQILQETGHTVLERITSVTNALVTTEGTWHSAGTFNGSTSVTDIGTATNTINNMGQIGDGKGQGLLRTSDGSMAAFKEKYTGSQDIHGNTNIQGTMNFTSLATGKLASLHGTTLLFKVQTNPSGDSTLRAWEIK